jgi:hypothetical protein
VRAALGYNRAMGLLDEAGLAALVADGCKACGGKKLAFRSYIDARVPLLGGEPVGAFVWVHDGEKFVDGVFEVACADCKASVFSADVCPRCHAEGGLAVALAATNGWPVPRECPGCGGDELFYRALVPARTTHEGKRAEKPRTTTEMHDPGFHGLRADCGDCGTIAERVDSCPLCHAPAPLRERPGD